MITKNKRSVFPTEEEVTENERKYLETAKKLDDLEEEYKKLKNSLTCRYCGGIHYSNGYCSACYQRVKHGIPLQRVTTKTRKNFVKNISKIYEEGFGNQSDLMDFDFEQIVESSKLDDRKKAIMKMYFLDNSTYEKIGEKYGITKQRVGELIRSGMRKCNLKWKK